MFKKIIALCLLMGVWTLSPASVKMAPKEMSEETRECV